MDLDSSRAEAAVNGKLSVKRSTNSDDDVVGNGYSGRRESEHRWCESPPAELRDGQTYFHDIYENGYDDTLTNDDDEFLNYERRSQGSGEFLSPEAILEEPADFIDSVTEDYTTLDRLLSIAGEPHFIAAALDEADKKEALEECLEFPDDSNMGVENTWAEEFTVPIALPAPPERTNYSDFSTCSNYDVVQHGPYNNDLESLFLANEDTDVTAIDAEKGVCGLRNLGNTCFMSTGIQCLVATKSIMDFFTEDLNIESTDKNSLTVEFADLVSKMWSGKYSVIHPTKFKQALGDYYPQFKDCSQHDCQEFLALLLDVLHQQLLNIQTSKTEEKKIVDCEERNVSPREVVDSNGQEENDGMEFGEKYGMLRFVCLYGNEYQNSAINGERTRASPVTPAPPSSPSTPARKAIGRRWRGRSAAPLVGPLSAHAQADECCTNLGYNANMKRFKNQISEDVNCLNKTSDKSVSTDNGEVTREERIEVEKEDETKHVDERIAKMEVDESLLDDYDAMRIEYLSKISEDDDGCDEEAEKQWKKHVSNNRSIIFDSFQGQFKNTVVCSVCHFKSVTYEPFMYLSVPLPHAIEKQLVVTFVAADGSPPTKYLLSVAKQDDIAKVRQCLLKLLPKEPENPIVFCEVLDYHISKILTDTQHVRYLEDVHRSICAFEQLSVPEIKPALPEIKPESVSEECEKIVPVNGPQQQEITEVQCCICIELRELEIVKLHRGCTCLICDACLLQFKQHFLDEVLKCPVCRNDMPDEHLVPVEHANLETKPTKKILNIPLVFRVDTCYKGGSEQKIMNLIGSAALLKVPNKVLGEKLYEVVSKLNPYKKEFKLLFVDGQGKRCSRCMYNEYCYGCAISPSAEVELRNNDTISVTFSEDMDEIPKVEHSSMNSLRVEKTLSLYDCVHAFSQSEILDEFNPWYCPQCDKNQCATKTLSVWRYPKYLIVYLKRFVFYECAGIKLEDKVMFPLHGFSLSKKHAPYDLYACVCHSGGVSVGHYISYTQHPVSHEWHCFNDETVTAQIPKSDEQCNAYILFYKIRGTM